MALLTPEPEHSAGSAAPAAQPAYCSTPYGYGRRPARVVMVGDVGIGEQHPIRVQSMTTTRTRDTDATVAQTVRLVEAGCELVRITAPTVEDARYLREIRQRLRRRGIRVPLVADIHFQPLAALEAAKWVEKVRINPGNYADSKRFAQREYSDAEYQAELERIEQRFAPLVRMCKEYGVAMRIGTNHGSLSDRIMNRFGDTPLGMVESALEFVRICARYGYGDVVLSMKASNPKIMIQAYRLLAARMAGEGMDYPFHLGVTEAGMGDDGRIKSAIGIASLLDDGIGDTVRVSLTEEPEAEIPVALELVRPYNEALRRSRLDVFRRLPDLRTPYSYERLGMDVVFTGKVGVGRGQPVRVVQTLAGPLAELRQGVVRALRLAALNSDTSPRPDALAVEVETAADVTALRTLRRQLKEQMTPVSLWVRTDPASHLLPRVLREADAVAFTVDDGHVRTGLQAGLRLARTARVPVVLEGRSDGCLPTFIADADTASVERRVADVLKAVEVAEAVGHRQLILSLQAGDVSLAIRAYRLLASIQLETRRSYPMHLVASQPHDAPGNIVWPAAQLGALLADGIGDSVQVIAGDCPDDLADAGRAFAILQGAGVRHSKADFVACPSCGRTLFDLQSTTERIQRQTAHLKGVKIAVMGCVVNGPGEMADADFGYVGGAPGRVNLYAGKECVEKSIRNEEADRRLIELIKARGRWTDPPSTSMSTG